MNRLKQFLQKINLNRISQIISHISGQNAKHVVNIFSQVIRFNIHRNNESSLKSHQIQQSLIYLLMFERFLQIFVFANYLEFSNSIRESETFLQRW
jgi:hypothetical protein